MSRSGTLAVGAACAWAWPTINPAGSSPPLSGVFSHIVTIAYVGFLFEDKS